LETSVMHLKPTLNFTSANKLLSAALACATERDVSVSVAIVDDAGELMAFSRMDGARSYTVDLASEKARGAAKLGLPTSVLESLGRKVSSGNTWSKGGNPILHHGQCAGAIGVSGAQPEIDEEIAARAVASLEDKRG
jgi:glc operon protein GlcG